MLHERVYFATGSRHGRCAFSYRIESAAVGFLPLVSDKGAMRRGMRYTRHCRIRVNAIFTAAGERVRSPARCGGAPIFG